MLTGTDRGEYVRGDRWKDGLQLNLRIRPDGLALAALYALACWGARKLSLDQFYLPAGIRVAALLLCPPRVWPYLFLGEYAYFAQMRYPMVEKYGLTWVIAGSACLMPAIAWVVHLHRRMMTAHTEAWLLSIAASAALAATVLKLGLSHLLWPVPPSLPILNSAVRFALGDYVGILTIAPLALIWAKRDVAYDWGPWRRPPTVIALSSLTILGLLTGLSPDEGEIATSSLQLVMALPVVALTCMHGWRGAAVGVPLLNLIISATMPSTGLPGSYDAATFATQQIIAVAGTALLVLGSKITHYFHQYSRRDMDGKRAITLSRTAHIASEMELRERVLGIKRIADGLEAFIEETVELLKVHGHHVAAARLLCASKAHSREFRDQTSMVYPTALEQVGLYLALQVSGARETWDATDRVSRLRLDGDPCMLSIGVQLATYRILTDAVSMLIKNEPGQIQIRARCGRARAQRGILVTVGLLDPHRSLSAATIALATERLTARALTYGGTVCCQQNRIRILLVDPQVPSAAEQNPTPRVLRPGNR